MDPEGHWDRTPSCPAVRLWSGQTLVPLIAWTLRFLFLKLPFPHWGHPLCHPTVSPAPLGYERLPLPLSTFQDPSGSKGPQALWAWPGVSVLPVLLQVCL